MSLLFKYSIVLLSCLLSLTSTASIKTRLIDFEDCGSQFNLVKLSLHTCSSLPCRVESGNFVSFTAEFSTIDNSTYLARSMTHEAFWVLDDVVTNAILLPSTCNYSGDCPSIITKGILQFTSEVFVSATLPTLRGTLHWKTKNIYGETLLCYNIPVLIE